MKPTPVKRARYTVGSSRWAVPNIKAPGEQDSYLPCGHSAAIECKKCEPSCLLVMSEGEMKCVREGHCTCFTRATYCDVYCDCSAACESRPVCSFSVGISPFSSLSLVRPSSGQTADTLRAAMISRIGSRRFRGCRCLNGCNATCECYVAQRECDNTICGCDVGCVFSSLARCVAILKLIDGTLLHDSESLFGRRFSLSKL